MPDFESALQSRLAALFGSLGSADRLRNILRDFYGRMAADTMLGFFFVGRDLGQIADRQAEFLLRAMGQAPSYTGRPPAQAHGTLPPILPGHFDRRLVILRETLQAHGLSAQDIRTWVDFEDAFRPGITRD